MGTGATLTIEVAFGGGQKATVNYSVGLTNDHIDLHQVMVADALSSAAKNIITELGEHALTEIRQQIAYRHAKEQ